MAPGNANTGATPMASDINAAARAERNKAIAALDGLRKAIDDQWSRMSSGQKQDALKRIGDITKQQEAISAAFVENIFNSKTHQDVIGQISVARQKMTEAAKQVTDVASLLTGATRVIGYAAQVAGLFASLAA